MAEEMEHLSFVDRKEQKLRNVVFFFYLLVSTKNYWMVRLVEIVLE